MTNAWLPTVGWNNFADWCRERYFIGNAWNGYDARMAAEASPAIVVVGCLAAQASIGVENPRYVEIGTQYGVSASVLLHVAERMNGHVVSMDPDAACFNAEAHARLLAKGCDLSRWAYTIGRSQDVPPMPSDFLFVDGDHSYPAVCADMATHGVAVRPGGIIVLDDYHLQFPGKARWIMERWGALRPLIIGPMAVIVKEARHDEIFTAVIGHPEDVRWEWRA